MNDTVHNILKYISILVALAGIMYFYSFTQKDEEDKGDLKMSLNSSVDPVKDERVKRIPWDGLTSRKERIINTSFDIPEDSSRSRAGKVLREEIVDREKKQPDSSVISNTHSGEEGKTSYNINVLKVSISDIANSDNLDNGYVLRKLDLFNKESISENLLSLLQVLNRKNMPPDYYRWNEYNKAYEEIDFLYYNTYIWPYFTHTAAKVNFFLYLLRRYSEDSSKWRPYEKDKSDCSQFSQRVYLFLCPDEIYMPDKGYFFFLFSDSKNRSERIKLCNKIPNVFYTVIHSYSLKKYNEFREDPNFHHAMISFAPDNNIENFILCEPQGGAFTYFREYDGTLVNKEFREYPFLCELSKITSITGDKYHEANTRLHTVFLFPQTVFSDKKNFMSSMEMSKNPRYDYGPNPIQVEKNAYQVFTLVSSYLAQIINYETVNRSNFLSSIEYIFRNENGQLTVPQMENAIKEAVDIIMHALIDLDESDLRRVRNEMKELKSLLKDQENHSPYIEYFIGELNYLFLLKLEPFL